MRKSDPPILVEQDFNASLEVVWAAITDVQLMRQWYFDNIPDFRAEVGFTTQFSIENEGREFLHLWTVTAVEPLKRLAYDWRYDQYPGAGEVIFDLARRGAHTRLKLTMHVHEDFPADIPEFTRESCTAGWEYFIKHSLRDYLLTE